MNKSETSRILRYHLLPGVLLGLLVFSVKAQTWQPSGGPTGGYVLSLGVHPINPNIVYAGTRGGDLYKTTNGGGQWVRLRFFSSSIWSLAINPTNPDVVYAGTEANGLFKTADGGTTWTSISLTSKRINAVVIDPRNPAILYAGVDDEGVYKSTNTGSTWWLANVGLTDRRVRALTIDPSNSQVLYAGTSSGVFKTESAGATWTSKYSAGFISSISVDPQNSSVIYAGEFSWGSGVFKSVDAGANWTEMNNGLANRYVHAIATDPSATSTVYAGTAAGIFKSVTSGSSWSRNHAPSNSSIVKTIAIAPSDPRTIYTGFDGDGIYKSTDEGGTWVAVNEGLLNILVNDIVVHPTNNNVLFAATGFEGTGTPSNTYGFGGGVYRSTDGGLKWQLVKELIDVYQLAIDPGNAAVMYAGSHREGIYKSLDGGTSWNGFNSGLSSKEVWSVAVDPHNSSVVYAATTGGLYKSADAGSNWIWINLTYGTVYSVLADPTTPNTVYAGLEGSIHRSNDGGSTWSRLGTDINGWDVIYKLAFREGNPNVLYAGGGYLEWGTGNPRGSVYALASGSSSWSRVLDGVLCQDIVIDPVDRTEMYVSTYGSGIYRSTNGGSTWSQASSGSPYLTSYAIAIAGRNVYAAFRYGSIWKTATVTAVGSEDQLAFSFALGQNYPNPFNPSTTIEFSLPKTEYVTLQIYNLLGEKVTTLASERLQAGTHSVRWNAVGIPSGVYFYRLQAGEFTETKKLILLR